MKIMIERERVLKIIETSQTDLYITRITKQKVMDKFEDMLKNIKQCEGCDNEAKETSNLCHTCYDEFLEVLKNE